MNELIEISERLSLIDESKVERVVLAKRVGQVMASGQAEDDLIMLEGLARNLCRDDTDAVRGALSFELRRCEELSPDIAEIIAFDDPDVAAPFLQTSPALDDDLLLRVVEKSDSLSQIAIARRLSVSAAVGEALAEYGDERAVTSLARNRGAELNEKICDKLLVRFSNSVSVIGELATRDDVPKATMAKVSGLFQKGPKKKPADSEVPFAVMLAKIRVLHRLGDLKSERILNIVEQEGHDGLEAILMALTDQPRRNITKALNSGTDNVRDAIFKDAKMPPALQQRILAVLKA